MLMLMIEYGVARVRRALVELRTYALDRLAAYLLRTLDDVRIEWAAQTA